MSRKAKTKTIGGGSSVTVSKTLPAADDLMALVEAVAAASQKKDGEYTREELMAKLGGEAQWDKFRRDHASEIDRRQVGRNAYLYSLKTPAEGGGVDAA